MWNTMRLVLNPLTAERIWERGRRSVTLGRDAVGWLSFSVDVTTASRSISAQKHHEKKKNKHKKDETLSEILENRIRRMEAPVSQTHRRHVTYQGQNLMLKPRPQIWGFQTWAGKLCNIRPCIIGYSQTFAVSVGISLWVLTLVWVVSRDAVGGGRKRRSLTLGGGVSWECGKEGKA